MIKILDKSNCCGCSACVQICPEKCIKMKQDLEGFYYPYIDNTKCINCDLCEKTCPVKNAKKRDNRVLNTYVAYIQKEDIRLQSSSGGMFTLLAEEILSRNGIVFGAAFDEKFLVHHISIDNEKDLSKLRGSKYLQSRIENTYFEAKKFLNAGRFVLYSGTACQIAGLKKYLCKSYEKLYTIDVLCHGVPSPKAWEAYLRYQEDQHKSSVKSISFRNKVKGWKIFSMQLSFRNSEKYEEIFKNDYFMQLFLRNICLRPSCYDCKFKNLNRPSDVTLGDCWGIETYMPDMDDDKGTSVILIHSENGQKLFDNLKNQIVYKTAEVDKSLPPDADSRKPVSMHPKRDIFFKRLEEGADIYQLVSLTEPGGVKRKIKSFVKKLITHKM